MEHRFILKVIEESPKPIAGFIRSENKTKVAGAVISVVSDSEDVSESTYRAARSIAVNRFFDAGIKVKKVSEVSEFQGNQAGETKFYISAGTDQVYQVIGIVSKPDALSGSDS